MMNEFRKFIARGNVMDLAIGIIMGAAFTGIVNSLVKDIMMPPIGLMMQGVDFTEMYINLSGGEYESLAEAQKAGAATINYGVFLNQVINFFIVSVSVFLLVKQFNRFQEKEAKKPPVPSAPTQSEKLLEEIRDLLKSQNGAPKA